MRQTYGYGPGTLPEASSVGVLYSKGARKRNGEKLDFVVTQKSGPSFDPTLGTPDGREDQSRHGPMWTRGMPAPFSVPRQDYGTGTPTSSSNVPMTSNSADPTKQTTKVPLAALHSSTSSTNAIHSTSNSHLQQTNQPPLGNRSSDMDPGSPLFRTPHR